MPSEASIKIRLKNCLMATTLPIDLNANLSTPDSTLPQLDTNLY